MASFTCWVRLFSSQSQLISMIVTCTMMSFVINTVTSDESLYRKKRKILVFDMKTLITFVFLHPGWFQAILPKSALLVEEEAWNAYPYTRTIFRCPFIQKFMLEIETWYYNDGGDQENVFNLSAAEKRSRVVGKCGIPV